MCHTQSDQLWCVMSSTLNVGSSTQSQDFKVSFIRLIKHEPLTLMPSFSFLCYCLITSTSALFPVFVSCNSHGHLDDLHPADLTHWDGMELPGRVSRCQRWLCPPLTLAIISLRLNLLLTCGCVSHTQSPNLLLCSVSPSISHVPGVSQRKVCARIRVHAWAL